MTSKSMTFRFPMRLAQAIKAQVKATGRDRTTVVTEALMQHFTMRPVKDSLTLEMLQRHIEQVEGSLMSLAEPLAAVQ